MQCIATEGVEEEVAAGGGDFREDGAVVLEANVDLEGVAVVEELVVAGAVAALVEASKEETAPNKGNLVAATETSLAG